MIAICRCGVSYQDRGQLGRCPQCRKQPETGYSEADELRIIHRANLAERAGIIPPWRARDSERGIVFSAGRRRWMALEEFDFWLANMIRLAKRGRAV